MTSMYLSIKLVLNIFAFFLGLFVVNSLMFSISFMIDPFGENYCKWLLEANIDARHVVSISEGWKLLMRVSLGYTDFIQVQLCLTSYLRLSPAF